MDDPYVRSSPETFSCRFCHADLGYTWTREGRERVERHKATCPVIANRPLRANERIVTSEYELGTDA